MRLSFDSVRDAPLQATEYHFPTLQGFKVLENLNSVASREVAVASPGQPRVVSLLCLHHGEQETVKGCWYLLYEDVLSVLCLMMIDAV